MTKLEVILYICILYFLMVYLAIKIY